MFFLMWVIYFEVFLVNNLYSYSIQFVFLLSLCLIFHKNKINKVKKNLKIKAEARLCTYAWKSKSQDDLFFKFMIFCYSVKCLSDGQAVTDVSHSVIVSETKKKSMTLMYTYSVTNTKGKINWLKNHYWGY